CGATASPPWSPGTGPSPPVGHGGSSATASAAGRPTTAPSSGCADCSPAPPQGSWYRWTPVAGHHRRGSPASSTPGTRAAAPRGAERRSGTTTTSSPSRRVGPPAGRTSRAPVRPATTSRRRRGGGPAPDLGTAMSWRSPRPPATGTCRSRPLFPGVTGTTRTSPPSVTSGAGRSRTGGPSSGPGPPDTAASPDGRPAGHVGWPAGVSVEVSDPFVRVRGASEHNLRNVDVAIPRDALVVFTGVSGSGKSSLAFGTIYAEAQRRYFESVAPYARRLLQQVGAPRVREITGLPPAVALQQRRGAPSARSTVGTITTLSNLLRMLYSRAGTSPEGAERLDAEAFSPNTVAGACPRCHGHGGAHAVTEALLVPDPSRSIRAGAIAAWPSGWQGRNLRSVVTGPGIDGAPPWRERPPEDRHFLPCSDEQPTVVVAPEPDRLEHGYRGRFRSARKHVMHVLAGSRNQRMRDRAMRFVRSVTCPDCRGSRLRAEPAAVTFAGRTIAEVNDLPLTEVAELLRPVAELTGPEAATPTAESGESTEVAVRISADLLRRIEVLLDLGLGYLSLG